MKLKARDIQQKIEQLQAGQSLQFSLHTTFGGGIVIIEPNPLYPGKKEKKYLLKWRPDEQQARASAPHWTSDKSKDLARWVEERMGDLAG